jgi:hypothetical protein
MISLDMTIPRKLASLERSGFRSKFKLTPKDRDYIATKGLETIKAHASQFIKSRVAPPAHLILSPGTTDVQPGEYFTGPSFFV